MRAPFRHSIKLNTMSELHLALPIIPIIMPFFSAAAILYINPNGFRPESHSSRGRIGTPPAPLSSFVG